MSWPTSPYGYGQTNREAKDRNIANDRAQGIAPGDAPHQSREAKDKSTAGNRANGAGHGYGSPQGRMPNPYNQPPSGYPYQGQPQQMHHHQFQPQSYPGTAYNVGRGALPPPAPHAQQPPVYAQPYDKNNPNPHKMNYYQ